MTDLIGSATVRVSSNTDPAARAIRQFATRAETQLRGVQRLSPITITTRFNDQTRRDLTTIRAAVTDLQRLGPVRIPVQINDGTRRGARSVQATVASLQRLGPIRIGADIDVDPTTTAASASALRAVQDAARGAARALGTLATRATTATAALTALGAAARSLRGDMDDLDGSIRRAGAGMTGLRGRLGTISTSASSAGSALDGLKTAALLLSPALIPIAVQAAPIAAGLAAATVAVGAFGLAIGGQIASLAEASNAEKKYKDAVDQHGAASQEAAKAQQAYQRAIADLPKPTRTAAAALSLMKTEYREWSDSLADSTMPVATKSFAVFGALFPKLTPLVQGASSQLDRFVTIAAGGIQSPGFERFMQSFADFATGAMASANDALIRFGRTLNTTQVSNGTSEFMEYVRANGPLVRDTLSNVSHALGNILEAAAEAGPGMLTVVNALASLVGAVPPGVITTMLQLALALKAVRLAAAGAAAIAGGVTAFTAAITGMRTAAAGATGVLPRLAAAFGTLSRAAKVAVAGTGLGLLVIAISELSEIGRKAPPDVDKMTTSLGRLAQTGKATGEAARVFGSDFKDLGEALSTLARPSNLDKVQQSLTSLIGMDSTPVKDAKEVFEGLDEGLTSLVKGGNLELAGAALEAVTKNLKKQGFTAEEINAQLDGYNGALADLALEQELTAAAAGMFAAQARTTSAALADQKMNADGLREALIALNEVNRGAHDAQTNFERSLDALTKSFKEHGATLNDDTAAGQANRDAMSAAAKARDELVASGVAANESLATMTSKSEKLRTEMMRLATEAFGGNTKKAKEYTDTLLGTPAQVTTLIRAEEKQALAGLKDVQAEIQKTPGSKSVQVDTLNAAAITALEEVGLKTRQLPNGKTEVSTKNGQALGSIKAVREALANLNGRVAVTWTYHNIQTNYVPAAVKSGKGSLHDVVGATGGLYTGRTFKHRGYARGGLVDGPGTETSDSVFAPWLSKNEFVVNAKQTARHLPLLKAINSGGLGMAEGGMAGAGADVGAGLASGLAGATGSVLAAARAMAGAVSDGVRRELQIASPSKVMKALAKDVGKGFISGLTGSRDKIKAVSKDLAKDVKAAFSGKKESALLKMIESDTKKLLSAAKKRDAVEKKIAEAKKFATDTANEARATGSLATIVQPDHFSPKYVKGQMQASLKQIKDFTANVKKLQKKGLNKDLLKQILEMGPEEGAAFAKSLAGADKATIKQYNSLNKQISAESSKLGKYGADLLYDSGKKAGDGFLTGLKAQQKDIEKLMLNIAKGMQKAIKKALGIKSPSRVFAMIGRNVGDGFVSGIAATHAKVATAAQKMGDTASTTARRHLTSVPSAVARGASSPQIPSGTLTALARQNNRSRSADVHHHYHVTLENRGVIGSPMQVQDWLARGLDQLARTGRIPSSMRGAA